ncbi:ATP-binding domain-containing protein, partial [Candidatus Pacearchaeota archaeon]|nr:ATP-binding domain-containing protein [Candidatus Pacearchaeota archaeon]
GKASSVLQSKLKSFNIEYPNDYVGTIHGLIYRPKTVEDENGVQKIVGWERHSEITQHIIIIDEASMVNQEIFKDLSFYRRPIIAVGDHGQLPPIGDSFGLVHTPVFILKTIHRQALKSPIIGLSVNIRRTGWIKPGAYSQEVFKLDWNSDICQKMFNKIQWNKDLIALCGFNQTRANLNNMVRDQLKFKLKEPYTGERVICLKNNHDTKIMNGQLGTVNWLTHKTGKVYEMTIDMDGSHEYYCNLVSNYCFGRVTYDDSYNQTSKKRHSALLRRSGYDSVDAFDFGYAISVHRSQGSEWDKVVLFEQRSSHWDDQYYARWLYTAVTRAREKLFVIYNYW